MTQPIIKCPDCAQEILVIPDLKAMNVAIARHVESHAPHATKLRDRYVDQINFIHNSLIVQLFAKILVIASPEAPEQTVIQGKLGRYTHEGYYITKDSPPSWIEYINDVLKPLEGKKVKITVEEL